MSMPATNASIHLNGLARRLVQDGHLDEASALAAYEKAAEEKTPLVRYLVQQQLLDSLTIATTASQEFGIPLFDIEAMDLEQCAFKLVDDKLIQKHHALP
ncbi:MAG: type IV-A pilus assembly ATPase PilB, partial [Gammaproteobacteria bacterium]